MKASPHDDFAICAMPRRMRVVWTQHHIRQCIIEMFPEGWLNNVAIPCLEDLVNQSPFVDFANFLDERGIPGYVGSTTGQGCAARMEAALGRQAGALTTKHALPPLLGESSSAEEHFRAAVQFAEIGRLPFDEDVEAPYDLQYAAEATARQHQNLREFRLRCVQALRELSDRCRPITDALVARQPPTVSAVAGSVHVGLIAVLVMLARWPDRALAQRFITGFGITGIMEATGAFETTQVEEPVPLDVLFKESQALLG